MERDPKTPEDLVLRIPVSWADSYLQFRLPAECCPFCQHLRQQVQY